MPVYDFDFQRYVERRKGARAAERREGSAYAYAGDLRVRRVLARLRPVTLALESTVKLWQASARAELLGTSVRVTERSYPRVQAAVATAAARLHVTAPALHASPHPDVSVNTFGTDDEPVILLHAELCDSLSDGELLHAIGTELGRIQNGAVLLGTAHYFLHRAPGGFLKWIVGPARAAIDGWWRRAAFTADRAGLMCSRDLAVSAAALQKIARAEGGPHGDHDGDHDKRDDKSAGREEPALPGAMLGGRIAALEIFAAGAYYRSLSGETGGASPDDTDRRVSELLKGQP